jgi:hypothetical protein
LIIGIVNGDFRLLIQLVKVRSWSPRKSHIQGDRHIGRRAFHA